MTIAKHSSLAATEVESTLVQTLRPIFHLFEKSLSSEKSTIKEMFLHKKGKKTCYLYLEQMLEFLRCKHAL